MIKPHELRLGNYLAAPQPAKVTEIRDYSFDVGIGLYTYSSLHIGIEPIPLDETWLERFGFDKIIPFIHDIVSSDMNMRVRIHKTSTTTYGLGKYEFPSKPIYYVHELQNIYFALTGEEIKLKEA